MDPQEFSFSKKPITPAGHLSKRQSVISAILPADQASKGNYTTLSKRTFSNQGKTLIDADNDMASDNPLLDYNEQIRAPKFRSHRSVNDIGSVLLDLNEKDSNANDFSTLIMRSTSAAVDNNKDKKVYLPATADISRATSLNNEMTPSTSLGDETYNIDNYFKTSTSNNQMISNLETQTSPLSSKKNSNDSIVSSKKQPRFTMVPIRPIDEPKTPNYLPCVLRPVTSQSHQDYYSLKSIALTSTYADDTSDESSLSRSHWKPNNSTTKCYDCAKAFTILNRRHHCRKCGEIFCGDCLVAKAKLLPKDCEFDVNGVLSKVCFGCGKSWSDFLVENFKKLNDVNGGIAFPDFKKNRKLAEVSGDNSKTDMIDQKAVPADWTWSSF